MAFAHRHRAGTFHPRLQPQPSLALELDPDHLFAAGLVARYPRIAFDRNNYARSQLGPLAATSPIPPANVAWGVSPTSNGGAGGASFTVADTNGVLPSGSADSTQSCWITIDPTSSGVQHSGYLGWGSNAGTANAVRELRTSASTTVALFTNYSGGGPSGGSVLDLKAHHLVGVVAGGVWTLYLDGVSTGTPVSLTTSTTANSTLCVNKLVYTAATPIGGVDNVSIWNRALSAGDVAQLYARPYDDLRLRRRRTFFQAGAAAPGVTRKPFLVVLH